MTAVARAACPFTVERKVQISSASTTKVAPPVMQRCVNSMTVSTRGDSGTTCPLHSGQWFPQPAPDPVARTKAPHRMTRMLYPTTNHAYRTRPRVICFVVIAIAVAISTLYEEPALSACQFLGPLGGTLHSFYQGYAQATLLEFQDAIHSAARRCRHGVLQQRRVITGLQHHAR